MERQCPPSVTGTGTLQREGPHGQQPEGETVNAISFTQLLINNVSQLFNVSVHEPWWRDTKLQEK